MRTLGVVLIVSLAALSTSHLWAKGNNGGQNKPAQHKSTVAGNTNSSAATPELVLGEERVEPGIVFIFEGAIKDTVYPLIDHLKKEETSVHLEARANWDAANIPEGTPGEGFVAYLELTAEVTNQTTGYKTFVDLLPHINLIDNLHYARNLQLPGNASELYTVTFTVTSPIGKSHVSIHKDWKDSYGDSLMENTKFIYTDVDFRQIANATRT